MTYQAFFRWALERLEMRSLLDFSLDIERLAGHGPHAVWRAPDADREVVVWSSTDYLGMGHRG
jgi:5-aminolevulinate synthase